MTLYIDRRGQIALDIVLMMGQSVPAELTDLNSSNKPDAFWIGAEGTYGAEIKQPGEVLGKISDVTEQLSREYPTCDNLQLCIAGVIVPDPDGGCRVLNWYADGSGGRLSGIRGGLAFKQSYIGYRSWISSLQAWGIQVVELPNKLALATHLVASYQWGQKSVEEHTTFRKPLRLKHRMPQHSPAVLTLMSLVDSASGRTFLGPEAATALANSYSTVIAALSAPCGELATVQLASGRKLGPAMAAKVLRAVGRDNN